MSGQEIMAAAIQMSSTPDKEENLETAERLIRAAASSGADLVALPELWSCHGLEKATGRTPNPYPARPPSFWASIARELGIYLLGGSILEGDPRSIKLHNTSTFFRPDGEISAVYRKIHLFDVKAPDREYLESATIEPGEEIVTAKAGAATLGLSVCYDVRFPELYRSLALSGAQVLTVPAAFTLQTGKDHWELLLRARAVENQAFVIAPAQWGQEGRRPVDLREVHDRRPVGHRAGPVSGPRWVRPRSARSRLSRPLARGVSRPEEPSSRGVRRFVKIEVRVATPDDATVVAELFYHTILNVNVGDYSRNQVEAWAGPAPDTAMWSERIASDDSTRRMFIAVRDGQVVGFAELEEDGHIDTLYVHHEFQGLGVASRLLDRVEAQAQRLGISRLYTEAEHNRGTILPPQRLLGHCASAGRSP